MSELLKNFLNSTANNGLGKAISELAIEHINCLLTIWNINCNPQTHEHYETDVELAFGDADLYSITDTCVGDLFEWKYLGWVIEGKTFRINPELGDSSLNEMIVRKQELESENDKDTHH